MCACFLRTQQCAKFFDANVILRRLACSALFGVGLAGCFGVCFVWSACGFWLWVGFCWDCLLPFGWWVCLFVWLLPGSFGVWVALFFYGEFDPGSGRTLAACLTHASRTMKLQLAGVD